MLVLAPAGFYVPDISDLSVDKSVQVVHVLATSRLANGRVKSNIDCAEIYLP